MKVYELNLTQRIDAPLERVFDFFSKPENLAEITPSKLGFNILTPSPILMKKGTLIDYTIRLVGFPVRWRTLITFYDPPKKFIDEQIKGPYSFWRHTHTFKAINGGVEMKDIVRYVIPFGVLGRLLHFLWIKNDLKKIFNYRKQVIDKVLVNDYDPNKKEIKEKI